MYPFKLDFPIATFDDWRVNGHFQLRLMTQEDVSACDHQDQPIAGMTLQELYEWLLLVNNLNMIFKCP